MNAPNRRWVLKIEIHGDTWDAVVGELADLVNQGTFDRESVQGTGGSPRTGFVIRSEESPEMTPEKYRAALDAYLDFLDAEGSS